MVDDTELRDRVIQILSTSDLSTTSAGAVRRQLESDFAIDLSLRKKFISQLIDDVIQHINANQEHEPEPEEEAEPLEDEPEPEDEEEAEPPLKDEPEDEEDTPSIEPAEKKKRKPSGFTKVCGLSPALHEFLGVSEMARTEVVKKLWEYIRENELQDPKNRRNIKCDDKLHSIFRVKTINMFQMNKVLSKHIWPLETVDEGSARPQKKQKREVEDGEEEEEDDESDVEKPKPKPKPRAKAKAKAKAKTKDKDKQENTKTSTSGFLKPLQLSEAFANFIGTGETTLSRAEAVKRIWAYIKQNDLQDPSDKRRILCDDKLKELFEVDTFNGFSVTKYLTAHLSKVEQ